MVWKCQLSVKKIIRREDAKNAKEISEEKKLFIVDVLATFAP